MAEESKAEGSSRKLFMCNGPFHVDDAVHYMKKGDESDVGVLVECVSQGRVTCLHGSPQSGKTTLLRALAAELRGGGRFSVVAITGEDMNFGPAMASNNVWEAINRGVVDAAGASGTPTRPDNARERSSPHWLSHAFPLPLVLLFDEFVEVTKLNRAVCDELLHGFRGALVKPDSDAAFRLHSLVICGPYGLLELKTDPSTGLSPWNVTFAVGMPALGAEHLSALFVSDAMVGGMSVDDAVVADVLALTGGHRGWTMLAGVSVVGAEKSLRSRPGGCGRISQDVWQTFIRPRYLHVLEAQRITEDLQDWVRGLGAGIAFQLPALLRTAAARAASGNPVRRNEIGWAGEHADVWNPLLAVLTRFGVLLHTEDQAFIPGLPPLQSAIEVALRAMASRVPLCPSGLDLHECDTCDLLLQAVQCASVLVGSQFLHTKGVSKAVGGIPVPLESTYQTAVDYVLRRWLGDEAVVSNQTLPRSLQKADMHLPGRRVLIEIVCHQRAGPAIRLQSVAEHCARLVVQYGPAFPDYELWLLNFDCERELDGKDVVLGAAIGCNRMHVVMKLEDPVDVDTVAVWRVGTTDKAQLL